MMSSIFNKFLLAMALVMSSLAFVYAQEEGHEGEVPAKHGEKEGFNVGDMIMHHIKDEHGWEFAHGVTLPLPVILYSQDRGLEIFSSSELADEKIYKGYKQEHGKVHRVDEAGKVDHEAKVYDFSITKKRGITLVECVDPVADLPGC